MTVKWVEGKIKGELQRVWYEIPKLKIPTGQNPETQNPEIQNPDRFKIPTGSKSRQAKIPTGSKSRKVKFNFRLDFAIHRPVLHVKSRDHIFIF